MWYCLGILKLTTLTLYSVQVLVFNNNSKKQPLDKGSVTVQQYASMAVQQYNSMAVQQYVSIAAQQYGGTATCESSSTAVWQCSNKFTPNY